MCTVVVMPLVGGGLLLAGNRDESVLRARAEPPSLRTAGDVRWLAPTDPDGGGTWTAVNAAGCALSVLNNYQVRRPEPADPLSRGQLVAALADAPDLATVAQRLRSPELALRRLRPFILVAAMAGPDGALQGMEASWEGAELTVVWRALPWMRTSNGTDIARATEARDQAFERHLGGLSGVQGADDPALDAFFASHHPRRNPWSVCMHFEPFAHTVSHTRIEVGPERVTMTYREGNPCQSGAPARLALARR